MLPNNHCSVVKKRSFFQDSLVETHRAAFLTIQCSIGQNVLLCAKLVCCAWRERGEQEAQAKADHEAMMNRMCELEQMVDDAGGASEHYTRGGPELELLSFPLANGVLSLCPPPPPPRLSLVGSVRVSVGSATKGTATPPFCTASILYSGFSTHDTLFYRSVLLATLVSD